jgi:cardiolipin synthase
MLNKNFFTVANLITVSGFVLGSFSYFFIESNRYLAFLLYALAWITDLLDGYVARKIKEKNQEQGVSALGKVIDPLRDKFLVLVGLAFDPIWIPFFVLIELVSFIFSSLVRKIKKEHFITHISKTVTVFQGVGLCMIFFFEPQYYAIMYAVLLFLSFLRLISYFKEFLREKRGRTLRELFFNS